MSGESEKISVSLIKVEGEGLSDSAKLLIKRVSQAIGGVFAPWQIRRVAKAQADAAIITADASLEISERQRRAAQRWLVEEEKKQKNMEDILQQAAPRVEATAKPEDIEEDWLTSFFEKSRLTSDADMQALWARILAGEANSPGKFSKRTLGLVSELEKAEAEQFQTLCRFKFDAIPHSPLVFDVRDPIYSTNGLSWPILNHLVDVGLISYETLTGFEYIFEAEFSLTSDWVKSVLFAGYHGRTLGVRPMNRQLKLGHVKLTRAGIDLAEICKPEPIPGFFDYVVNRWRTTSVVVEVTHGLVVRPELFAEFKPPGK